METETTYGEWKRSSTIHTDEYATTILAGDRNAPIAETKINVYVDIYEAEANAELIVTAVNACKAINPENPLNAAKVLPQMVKMLDAYFNDSSLFFGEWQIKMKDLLNQATEQKPI